MNTKIALTTLGCKVNQCDSAAIEQSLREKGFSIVPFGSSADIIIVNTCIVTGKTQAQSRNMIRRALKQRAGCRVIVTGCYAQKYPGDIAALSDRIFVRGNAEKEGIPDLAAHCCRSGCSRIIVSPISEKKTFTTPCGSTFLNRTRAFLKIQDGCNSRCTYCVVPSVRGPARSLSPREVHRRVTAFAQQSYPEIVLTGIHLGLYGRDLHPRTDVVSLVRSLEPLCTAHRMRVRLSSLEPREITGELISCMKNSGIICPHLHIPMQSGDSTVLKNMNRPYSPALFEELVHRLAESIPDINIGIDVIAGFPGETDLQFENTVSLLNRIPAGYLHVFPYSVREGTPAARFESMVPEKVKKERARVLRSISDEKKHRFYSSYTGRLLQVIPEKKSTAETGMLHGFSRNYIPVSFSGSAAALPENEIPVEITGVEGTRVSGVLKTEPGRLTPSGQLPAQA